MPFSARTIRLAAVSGNAATAQQGRRRGTGTGRRGSRPFARPRDVNAGGFQFSDSQRFAYKLFCTPGACPLPRRLQALAQAESATPSHKPVQTCGFPGFVTKCFSEPGRREHTLRSPTSIPRRRRQRRAFWAHFCAPFAGASGTSCDKAATITWRISRKTREPNPPDAIDLSSIVMLARYQLFGRQRAQSRERG